MATVLVDNEAFKITLQIIEDFISKDYDAFIENGPTEDKKIIKWELSIYFKKLEDKKKSIIEYYMIPIYNYMKKEFYRNGRYTYIVNCHNGRDSYCFDTLSIEIKKDILNKTITLKIICDETYKKNYRGFCITEIKIYTYLNNIQDLLRRLIDNGSTSLICINNGVRCYYKPDGCILIDKYINLHDDKLIWLKDIVKNYYNEILINFESYVLYCKTNGIDIDLKKISERITYIKEYVKKVYDLTLV